MFPPANDGAAQAPGQGGVSQPSAAPSAPPAPPAPPTPSAPVPASSAASGGSQPAAGVAPAAEQAAYQSVRDALANYGLDLRGQFQDDHAALQHLAGLARQAQEQARYLPYAQQYMQHAGQFQQWLAERQSAEQARQQQQQQWWTAPEYDPTWQRRLMRDPQTGEIRALPGEDPSIVQKYLAWTEHQRGFLDRFSRDPIGSIGPGIQQIVQQQAAQIVQQYLGQYQEQIAANQFLRDNAGWLYDQQAVDPRTGNPALTPMGQQFARYVYEAEQMGLRDGASQQKYALGLLQRDYLMARAQGGAQAQPAPPPPGENAAAQQFLQGAAAGAANVPAAPPGNANGGHRPPNGLTARGLAEAMMHDLRQAGIQPGQAL